MKIIAILAAYNLEKEIMKIVKSTLKFVDDVIVVSDASIDNTHKKAIEAGAKCPPHTSTRGKGFAVRKGIEFSKSLNPDIVILMDADGQHLPEEIPILVNEVKSGEYDMVVGSRMKGTLKTSMINKVGNFGLKLISWIMTGRWLTDTESGFRAFKANKLYSLELDSMSYEIESELLFKGLKKGFKVKEVPITVPIAVPGVTVMDGIKMGLYKIKIGVKSKLDR